jgi:cytochrome b561
MTDVALHETSDRYSVPLRLMHWAIVVLVLATFPLGAVIKFIGPETQMSFYTLHESFGFLVFWAMLLRIVVRSATRAPAPQDMPYVLHLAAHTVHGLLYVALVLQPMTGFLANCANGFFLDWFWLVPIACPVDRNPDLAKILLGAHVVGAYTILTLFLLHMGGVVFHHVIRRDNTLYRII